MMWCSDHTLIFADLMEDPCQPLINDHDIITIIVSTHNYHFHYDYNMIIIFIIIIT